MSVICGDNSRSGRIQRIGEGDVVGDGSRRGRRAHAGKNAAGQFFTSRNHHRSRRENDRRDRKVVVGTRMINRVHLRGRCWSARSALRDALA